MQHKLYGLRGQNYVKEYKQLFNELQIPLAKRFKELVEAEGNFTPLMLGQLANEFQLPLTALDDYLASIPEINYPCGTWERLKDRGCKAKDIGVKWH